MEKQGILSWTESDGDLNVHLENLIKGGFVTVIPLVYREAYTRNKKITEACIIVKSF
ncbi:MAG: hypothetical protein WC428_02375 [Candidatus Paceibacterota bacterium]